MGSLAFLSAHVTRAAARGRDLVGGARCGLHYALIRAALWLLIIVVFIQAILSWFAPDGPLAGLLNALTFPFLRPVRRIVPPIGGTLDLSPLIVIVLAQLALLLPVTWLESSLTRAFIG